MRQKIQAVQNDIAVQCTYCPFCGTKNLDLKGDLPEIEACPHLLFVATDDCWVYVSDRFLVSLNLSADEMNRIECMPPVETFERTSLEQSFYFYGYHGSLGGYIGYASVD